MKKFMSISFLLLAMITGVQAVNFDEELYYATPNKTRGGLSYMKPCWQLRNYENQIETIRSVLGDPNFSNRLSPIQANSFNKKFFLGIAQRKLAKEYNLPERYTPTKYTFSNWVASWYRK